LQGNFIWLVGDILGNQNLVFCLTIMFTKNTFYTHNTYQYIIQWRLIMETISATDLARNTRKILDKVASRGETVVIERNHTLIAKIGPPDQLMSASQVLAGIIFPVLTLKQSTAWVKDSKGAFSDVIGDPWA
jgi:antitoxin (DNA-binding transcriptional repressor) of toxin-antitoxin stability system